MNLTNLIKLINGYLKKGRVMPMDQKPLVSLITTLNLTEFSVLVAFIAHLHAPKVLHLFPHPLSVGYLTRSYSYCIFTHFDELNLSVDDPHC